MCLQRDSMQADFLDLTMSITSHILPGMPVDVPYMFRGTRHVFMPVSHSKVHKIWPKSACQPTLPCIWIPVYSTSSPWCIIMWNIYFSIYIFDRKMCSQLKMFYLLRIKLKTTKLVETIGWILISFKERQLPHGRRSSYHPRQRNFGAKLAKGGNLTIS